MVSEALHVLVCDLCEQERVVGLVFFRVVKALLALDLDLELTLALNLAGKLAARDNRVLLARCRYTRWHIQNSCDTLNRTIFKA